MDSAAAFGSPFSIVLYILSWPNPETSVMEKTKNMPMWVYLAFSSITSRKGALLLILACVVFSIYCIPWRVLLPDTDWVEQIFLVEDWSWFAMMLPITFWYWLSLRWIDDNAGWPDRRQHKGQSPRDP